MLPYTGQPGDATAADGSAPNGSLYSNLAEIAVLFPPISPTIPPPALPTRFPRKAPGGILNYDAISTLRPSSAADAEGIPETAFNPIYNGRGTLGTPTAADQLDAAQLRTKVDQVLGLPLGVDLLDDDQVVCSRGTFVVVSVTTRRLYQRAILRKIST